MTEKGKRLFGIASLHHSSSLLQCTIPRHCFAATFLVIASLQHSSSLLQCNIPRHCFAAPFLGIASVHHSSTLLRCIISRHCFSAPFLVIARSDSDEAIFILFQNPPITQKLPHLTLQKVTFCLYPNLLKPYKPKNSPFYFCKRCNFAL